MKLGRLCCYPMYYLNGASKIIALIIYPSQTRLQNLTSTPAVQTTTHIFTQFGITNRSHFLHTTTAQYKLSAEYIRIDCTPLLSCIRSPSSKLVCSCAQMQITSQDSAIVLSDSFGTKRLHIKPLTPTLLPKVLGSFLPLAHDVSFHHLATFPKRDYGFVTLPVAEAAMVKKKLQGNILRGEKIEIEDARPDNRKQKGIDERQEQSEAVSEPELKGRALRKRKREEGVIPGAVELPADRKVQRGWTEPKATTDAKRIEEKRENKGSKSEKPKTRSKGKASTYTDKEECLFQTTVPNGLSESDGIEKGKRNRNSRKGKNIVTVHEFANTTKHPSYLRQTANKDQRTIQEFDEEKGWVDEEGSVIEAIAKTSRKRRSGRTADTVAPEVAAMETVKLDEDEEETSSSGTSATSEDDEQSSSEPETDKIKPQTVGKVLRISVEPAVSITEPSPVTPHPLETLFKKPKPPTSENSTRSSLEINTSFSFFGGTDGDDDANRSQIENSLETPGIPALKRRGLPNLSIPVTPYSQRDMHWRSQRSAAPTPDTAAPGKGGFGDPFGMLANIHREREQDIEERGEEEDEQEDVMQGVEEGESSTVPLTELGTKPDGTAEEKESDFSKWFWENRGSNTRAWKQRKREAAKEQRNRETRKRKA